ncbi:MAG: ethanolamine ammonia-lyase subunit EutB [Syntrophaceae bacterium]|nr:ethanolamine ammonia-lyase subunit EutB [Syntrophaceae bacterium]
MNKASSPRSGDKLAGIAAESSQQRVAAKIVLSNLQLKDLYESPAVPYEEDEVTRAIIDGVNLKIYKEMSNWTVAETREWILLNDTTDEMLQRASRGLTSEMVAGVAKIMGDLDLIYAAKKIRVLRRCVTTVGQHGTLASRLQPNHTTDNLDGISASMYEGLSYGVGDALIGLNPVEDNVPHLTHVYEHIYGIKHKLKIPTQICILAHVTTQMECLRRGVPVDLLFQSLAGSQRANESFGISVEMLDEAYALALRESCAPGPNLMYFETGEGTELSADGSHGADQATMESRCYGLARRYNPFLVNTVVGFIGPEYIYNSKQLIRAGLENHFLAKMQCIPIGCDDCYINHMDADQNDLEQLAVLLSAAGCYYFMGIPHGDDPMLMYQSTGFHETPTLRELMGLEPAPEFKAWLEEWGIWKNGRLGPNAGDASIFL